MSIKLKLTIALSTLLVVHAMSQNLCQPVGWATQNGGTTGGGYGSPTIVKNYNDLKTAITSSAVKVVQIEGTIEIPTGGNINFQDQSGKTIYGIQGARLVSNDLTRSGIIYVKKCQNIIFKNIIFEGPGAYDNNGLDLMTLEESTNIWIDHCDFQDGIDGNLDIKTASDFISITWCKFSYSKPFKPGGIGGIDDHRFSNLFGSSNTATGDRGRLRITLQYCWWAEGCTERMPWVRFGKVHIVNNYYNSTASVTCVRVGFEADLLVEKNVFENVKEPIFFASKDFTAVTASDNVFTNCTGNTKGSGTAFTPPYSLTRTPVTEVKVKVTAGAGATLVNPTNDCITTNLQDQNIMEGALNIYPNPFNHYLLVEASEEASYSIKDLSGSELMKGKCFDKIDTRNLTNGTYIVSIETENIRLTKKIVKLY